MNTFKSTHHLHEHHSKTPHVLFFITALLISMISAMAIVVFLIFLTSFFTNNIY